MTASKLDASALAARFYETHRSFQADLFRLAEMTGKTPVEIYAMWLDYSELCSAYDQSAMLEEFVIWKRDDLDPSGALDLKSAI